MPTHRAGRRDRHGDGAFSDGGDTLFRPDGGRLGTDAAGMVMGAMDRGLRVSTIEAEARVEGQRHNSCCNPASMNRRKSRYSTAMQ